MFWYVFRIKPLRHRVEDYIKLLKYEHREMQERLLLLPAGSYARAFLEFGIAVYKFRIEWWKHVIGIK